MEEVYIIVCDQCLRSCCWQGEFMCDKAYSGGITHRPTSEL